MHQNRNVLMYEKFPLILPALTSNEAKNDFVINNKEKIVQSLIIST